MQQCEKSKTMGIGLVIRDPKGEVMASLSLPEPFHSKPIVAKLRAFWRAMIFCLELGFESV